MHRGRVGGMRWLLLSLWLLVEGALVPIREPQRCAVVTSDVPQPFCEVEFTAAQTACAARDQGKAPYWASIGNGLFGGDVTPMKSATSTDLDLSKPLRMVCNLRANDKVRLLGWPPDTIGVNAMRDANSFYSIVRIRIVSLAQPLTEPNLCHVGQEFFASIAGLSGLPGYWGCAGNDKQLNPCPVDCVGAQLQCNQFAAGSGCCSGTTGGQPLCTCPPGRTDSRAGCKGTCAAGISRCNTQGDCSVGAGRTTTSTAGVEVAFRTEDCRCATGYFGATCTVTCGGTPVCSGQGECVQFPAGPSTPQCLCNANRAGLQCERSLDDCRSAGGGTSALCNDRGLCVAGASSSDDTTTAR